MDKLKSRAFITEIPKFNHDIIDHYHVAWKFKDNSISNDNFIIHNVIDLKDCIPIEKEHIPSCIENGILKIINEYKTIPENSEEVI